MAQASAIEIETQLRNLRWMQSQKDGDGEELIISYFGSVKTYDEVMAMLKTRLEQAQSVNGSVYRKRVRE